VINSCVLVGRIARDPEMRYTTSGMAVVNFRIAVARQRRGQDQEEQTDWLDIVAFGKTGEFVAQYLDKGALIGVEGRIQSRNWQTQDGQQRYSVEIVANSVQALESRQEAERRRASRGANAGDGGAPAGQRGPRPQAVPSTMDSQEDYGPISEDEDPFGDQ
jgi:single-strand DNA-binding protein